jgi:hypothetical protein
VSSGARIVALEPADSAALRGCEAAWGAALDIDDPRGPRMTGQVLATWLRRGFTGDPAETEPAIERIDTGNASANDHMIAVNEVLGFELDAPEFHSVELAVTDVLA